MSENLNNDLFFKFKDENNILSDSEIKMLRYLSSELWVKTKSFLFPIDFILWLIEEIESKEEFEWNKFLTITDLTIMVFKLRLEQIKSEVNNLDEFESLKQAIAIKESLFKLFDSGVEWSKNSVLILQIDLEFMSSFLKETIDNHFNNIESNIEKLIFITIINEYILFQWDILLINKAVFMELINLLNDNLSERNNIERLSTSWKILVVIWLWVLLSWTAHVSWIATFVAWLATFIRSDSVNNESISNEDYRNKLLQFFNKYFPDVEKNQFDKIFQIIEENNLSEQEIIELIKSWEFDLNN